MSQTQPANPTAINSLILNRVEITDLTSGLNPQFQCPTCHYAWKPKLSLTTTPVATFDYNQQTDFIVPPHVNPATGAQCNASNQTVALFVAVHKDAKGTCVVVQRSDAEGANGINVNWSNRQ